MSERLRPRPPVWGFIILGLVLVILYIPIFVMIINSLVVPSASGDSWHWGIDWYPSILRDEDLLAALSRSFTVGIISSAVATVLGATASIALAKSTFRHGGKLNSLSFLSLTIPELVFALSLLSWFFILQVPLSLMTVIFSHVTFSLSFVLLTVNARIGSLDLSMDDAARDLGASEWRILRKVTIPLLVPAILSGFLLAFLLSFDDFLITFFTSGVGSDTLPIRLYVAMKTGLKPKLSALATLMLAISIFIMYLLYKVRNYRRLHRSEVI
jgi:spermidine/putrescine transport system permease protein